MINFKIFCGINFCNWSGLKNIPEKISSNKSQHLQEKFRKFSFHKASLPLKLAHIRKSRTYSEHIDLQWFKNMRTNTNICVSVGNNIIFSLTFAYILGRWSLRVSEIDIYNYHLSCDHRFFLLFYYLVYEFQNCWLTFDSFVDLLLQFTEANLRPNQLLGWNL